MLDPEANSQHINYIIVPPGTDTPAREENRLFTSSAVVSSASRNRKRRRVVEEEEEKKNIKESGGWVMGERLERDQKKLKKNIKKIERGCT